MVHRNSDSLRQSSMICCQYGRQSPMVTKQQHLTLRIDEVIFNALLANQNQLNGRGRLYGRLTDTFLTKCGQKGKLTVPI